MRSAKEAYEGNHSPSQRLCSRNKERQRCSP